jgi:UDP-glucose 4-epimerase
MRVCVTGGAGFIGSHLVERLLADGHDVRVFDDFSTGRLENLPTHPRLSVIRGDHLDPYDQYDGQRCCDWMVDRPIDWLFHLAALADIVPSVTNPFAYHRANVDLTVQAVESARACGVKRFIYAASSSCYGIPDVYPTPESAELRPQYPYALTKMVGEQYALHWLQVYGLPVVSLRLFNVYGPRHRTSGTYGAVMGVFLAQKANGQPLTVVGDGTQRRDFTHVSDVVNAMVIAAESDVTGVFNVGSGQAPSINELVELFDAPRVGIPKRSGEPDITLADTTKIEKALGWEPRVSFADGVRDLLLRMDDWKTAPVWTPDSIAEATASWHRHLTHV